MYFRLVDDLPCTQSVFQCVRFDIVHSTFQERQPHCDIMLRTLPFPPLLRGPPEGTVSRVVASVLGVWVDAAVLVGITGFLVWEDGAPLVSGATCAWSLVWRRYFGGNHYSHCSHISMSWKIFVSERKGSGIGVHFWVRSHRFVSNCKRRAKRAGVM